MPLYCGLSSKFFDHLVVVIVKRMNECMTHSQFVDGDGSDGRRVTSELSDEHELVQVPDDARAIARAADDDVVRGRRSQARHGLTVTKQRLLEHQPSSVTTLAKLPHVHHLTRVQPNSTHVTRPRRTTQ